MEITDRFRLKAAKTDHPAFQVALPLVSDHDGELRCIGTGFAVAPGLAITAAHVAQDWVDYASLATRFTKSFARLGIGEGPPREVTSEEIAEASKLEEFAANQQPDFPILHSLGAFRLWAILEAAVEDLVRYRLLQDPALRRNPLFLSIEGSLIEFLSATPEDQNEILIARLKQRLGTSFKIGVGRFESLLETIGLNGGVSDLTRRVLVELSEVRNVIAHRNGRADARLMKRCPWLRLQKGSPVVVTHLQFTRYVAASHCYLLELCRRADLARGNPPASAYHTELNHVLVSAEQRLQHLESNREFPSDGS